MEKILSICNDLALDWSSSSSQKPQNLLNQTPFLAFQTNKIPPLKCSLLKETNSEKLIYLLEKIDETKELIFSKKEEILQLEHFLETYNIYGTKQLGLFQIFLSELSLN